MVFRTFVPGIVLLIAGFVIAWQFVGPAPPRTVVIATGHQDGAYALYARRYRELLAAEGIRLDIRYTAGSLENIALLRDPSSGVDLAFVQGGVADAADAPGIQGLGSLYYEPLWLFYRSGVPIDRLTELAGKRIAIGSEGSGTRALVQQLLEDNRLDASAPGILSLGGDDAAAALVDGRVDAAFFVASPRSSLVQNLLHRQDIRLMSFARSTAYTRLHHALSGVTLPEGVIDLQTNIPAQDTALLAATANLVAKEDFHPALVSLLLQVLSQVHGQGGLFEQPGEFPAVDKLDVPPSPDAARYYRDGPPFLQRYLSFWAANFVDRIKVMLIPLITLLIPLFKITPPAYRWQVRKKIYRWYRELLALDIEHPENETPEQLTELRKRLDDLEEEVRKVRVPLSYSDELYELRLHIDLVRRRLQPAPVTD